MQEYVFDLIVKFLSGESSDEEDVVVACWLKEKPDNLRIFREWEMFWNAVGISLNRKKFNTGLTDRVKSIMGKN